MVYPSFNSGNDIAAPSGKFWRPIPKATAKAAPIFVLARVPKATPIASPSGILCRVMENSSKSDFLFSSLEHNFSSINNRIVPPIKPITVGNKMFVFWVSIAGNMSEKNEAAIIIPDENDSIASWIILFVFLKKKTILEPNAVIRNVIVPANRASNIGLRLLNIVPPIDRLFYKVRNVNDKYIIL